MHRNKDVIHVLVHILTLVLPHLLLLHLALLGT
jgi:hypothetical protein